VTFNSSNRHTIVLKGRSFERASLPGIYHFSNHHLSLLDRAIFSRSIQTLQQSISSHHALSFAPPRDCEPSLQPTLHRTMTGQLSGHPFQVPLFFLSSPTVAPSYPLLASTQARSGFTHY